MNSFWKFFLICIAVFAFAACEQPCQNPAAPASGAQDEMPADDADGLVVTPDNHKPVIVCDTQVFTAESTGTEELVWILDGKVVARGPEYLYTVEEEQGDCAMSKNRIGCPKKFFRLLDFMSSHHRLVVLEACTLERVKGWLVIDGGEMACRESDTDVTPPAPTDDTTPPASTDTDTTPPMDTDTPPSTDTNTTPPADTDVKPPADTSTKPSPSKPADTPAGPSTTPANNPTPANSITPLVGSYKLQSFSTNIQGMGVINERSPLIAKWSGSMTINPNGSANVTISMTLAMTDANGKPIASNEKINFAIDSVSGNSITIKPTNECKNNNKLTYTLSNNKLTLKFPANYCGAANFPAATFVFQK